MKRFGLSLLAFAGMLLGVATASAQHNHAKHHGDEEHCSERSEVQKDIERKEIGFKIFTTE